MLNKKALVLKTCIYSLVLWKKHLRPVVFQPSIDFFFLQHIVLSFFALFWTTTFFIILNTYIYHDFSFHSKQFTSSDVYKLASIDLAFLQIAVFVVPGLMAIFPHWNVKSKVINRADVWCRISPLNCHHQRQSDYRKLIINIVLTLNLRKKNRYKILPAPMHVMH